MGDSWITSIAIITAVIIMGIFPLMAMAQQTDVAANSAVQSATTKLNNEMRSTGILTLDQYQTFVSTLAALGNSYEANIEIQIADGNLDKKEGTSSEKIYFTMYHTQVMDDLSANGRIILNEHSVVTTVVYRTNITIFEQLGNIFNKKTGMDLKPKVAEATGLVITSGN